MVLYEMLTGATAFKADSITELCAAILEAPLAPIRMLRRDAPEELVGVIEKCLEKDPAKRYQSVAELALALMPLAPKRARINAERAVARLRAVGLADAEMRVVSDVPPAQSGPVPRSSVRIPPNSAPRVAVDTLDEALDSVSSAVPAATPQVKRSKRRVVAVAAVAALAVLVVGLTAGRAARGTAKAADTDAPPAKVAAQPVVPVGTAAEAPAEPPRPAALNQEPTAQPDPGPKPGAAFATNTSARATPAMPRVKRAAAGQQPNPSTPPKTTKKQNVADEPDLGY
jgi:serine/threonine-protein kinase